MPQDAYSLYYLCRELNEVLKNGKINKIVQPDNDTILLTVWTGKKTEKLYISVCPSCPRIGIIDREIEGILTAPNFCMLLRKHLLSATIEGISLVGFDRIVKIDLLPNAEFFDAEKKSLYIELMGRYSNVILTENGKVLGCNRGINFFDNGIRPLIVGKKYVEPPVGQKKQPCDEDLINYFEGYNGNDLDKYIFDGVQGLAFSTANEIVNRFNLENNQDFSRKLFEHLNNFVYKTELNPCVIKNGDLWTDVCVYPYKTAKGEPVFFDKLYQAEEFFFNQKDKDKDFKNRKNRLDGVVQTILKKNRKKLANLTLDEKGALNYQENKIKGELILSNCYNIKQGQSSCNVFDYYKNEMVEIPLDIHLTPTKNAENYFKKYAKQKRTLEFTSDRKSIVEKEIDYIESLADQITLTETKEDLISIQEELEQLGLIKKANAKAKPKELGCRKYGVDGFIIKAGRNNLENDKITFSANAKDMWLHSKDYHSTHVIIESGGREIPQEIIKIGAEICAYYSKARNSGKTEIVYTLKKNVKKPSKSKPGFCTYANFNSITVKGEKHAEFSKNN